MQSFIASQPTRQFWQIAHTDYDNPNEMTAAIQAAIKDMTMTTGDDITRREALCELASIPMIAMGRNTTLKASRYEEILRFCTAALEGCWELSQGSDMQGIRHAFECVSTYIPFLETIAHASGQYRKQALDLATRYTILKTRLAWICATPGAAAGCAEHAFFLSKETGNISLLMGACTKLTWSYFRNKNYAMGLKTIQEGEQTIKDYQRRNKGPALHPGMIGNFNSSYALAQVYNGIDPDVTIGAALDSKPLSEYVAFIEFTEDDQHYEAAKIYCLKGDPVRAMEQLEKLINTNTLILLPGVNQIEGVRLHIANHLTSALLQLPERDMGQITGAWTTAMQGAQERHNEVIYDEAMQNFAAMKALWPGEDAIRRLMPLTSHW